MYENITAAAMFTTTITRTASNGEQVLLKRDSYSRYKTALFNEMREGYKADGPVEPSTELVKGIKNHLQLVGFNFSDLHRYLLNSILFDFSSSSVV